MRQGHLDSCSPFRQEQLRVLPDHELRQIFRPDLIPEVKNLIVEPFEN